MSASSKKKLRKEQSAAAMTEKQLAEQKEAKKLKVYTAAFVVVIAALLVVAIWVGVNQTVTNSGIREKNTVALTIGEHKISNAELSYYYIDSINNFYSNYGSYASLFGLDLTQPLNEQYVDEESGLTWADDFLSSAADTAKSVYALVDAAKTVGYTATEEELAQIDTAISNVTLYATIYGYGDADSYLKAMYGNGASEKTYRTYLENSILADSYYNAYSDSLTYDDAALREAEADNYSAYSAFTYNYYYISADKFLEGGTTDEDGNTTYSDEEKAASVAAAEEAAASLIGEEITSVEDFDAAIAALSINADSTASSTLYEDYAYSSITEALREWITDSSRKEGDKTYIANAVTSVAEHEHTEEEHEHEEVTTVSGYYVLYYIGTNDNTFPLANVRHILIDFEGGTTDDSGNTTYSDEDKAATMTSAEALLAEWKAGDATEDSFAALANEKSTDTGSNTNGGLYEDVYPGQMVTAFNDWCFDESRKAGDTGVIETTYGCHIMYYVGDSDTTYRDYMITSELQSADLEEWYNGVLESVTMTPGNTDYINKDLVLSAS